MLFITPNEWNIMVQFFSSSSLLSLILVYKFNSLSILIFFPRRFVESGPVGAGVEAVYHPPSSLQLPGELQPVPSPQSPMSSGSSSPSDLSSPEFRVQEIVSFYFKTDSLNFSNLCRIFKSTWMQQNP